MPGQLLNPPFSSKMGSFFITATDTGVGKTTLTGALLLAFRQRGRTVGVMKPVETGMGSGPPAQSDTGRLRSLLSDPLPPWEVTCPYGYDAPLAPLACAQHTGITVDLSKILEQHACLTRQYSLVLVEGAGGLLTPLTPTQTIKDLIALLEIPCVVVSRTDLGAVNHTLLTLSSLQGAGIPTVGVLLNEPTPANDDPNILQQRTTTCHLLRAFSSVPIYGPVRHSEEINTDWQEGVRQLSRHAEIQRLVTALIEKAL
jgi:dethiobiotin synthetase